MTFVVNTTPAPLAAVFGVKVKVPGLPASTPGMVAPSVYPAVSIKHTPGCGPLLFFVNPTHDCPGSAPQKSCLGAVAVFAANQHSPVRTVPLSQRPDTQSGCAVHAASHAANVGALGLVLPFWISGGAFRMR